MQRVSDAVRTTHGSARPQRPKPRCKWLGASLARQHISYEPQQSFHQNGLGQALGSHLAAAAVSQTSAYPRTDYRNPSTSPPTLTQPSHATASPLFTVQQVASPALKRKQTDAQMSAQKRRRDVAEDADTFADMDGGGQGAKHWTDEEKTKLFTWLMAPGHEDHWNQLRATKNSCLRDVSHLYSYIRTTDTQPHPVRTRSLWWQKDLPGAQRMLRAQL